MRMEPLQSILLNSGDRVNNYLKNHFREPCLTKLPFKAIFFNYKSAKYFIEWLWEILSIAMVNKVSPAHFNNDRLDWIVPVKSFKYDRVAAAI